MHPQNTEDALLVTTIIIYYMVPFTLRRYAINICNVIHFPITTQ
jgi:hypothetical protein